MTVSNVINNKPSMTSLTRQRVQDAIDATGYVVNAAARALAGGRTNMLGVITPRINWPYVTEILQGASAAAEQQGLDLAIFTTASDSKLERERAKLLRTMADGILLIIPSTDESQVFDPHLPVVTIGSEGRYTISVDEEHGGRLAAEHLLKLGHRRIAHVRGTVTAARHDARDREHGFLEALGDAGVTLPTHHLLDGEFTEEGGEMAGYQLLSQAEPPTAVFAANDRSALGVMRSAQQLGLSVPRDLSVIGYDDIQAASLASPPLTTIRQPLLEMGAAAALQLVRLIRGEVPTDANLSFLTTLVVRSSTSSVAVPYLGFALP